MVLDGLDGRIARLTNTVSDFGREMDSLADVITFGIAPAVLAYCWGVQFVGPGGLLLDHRAGYFIAFLVSGVRRGASGALQRPDQSGSEESGPRGSEILRRPSDSGRCRDTRRHRVRFRQRAAGVVVPFGAVARLLALLSFLMVSTWRYPSFKEVNLTGPRSPLTVILFAALIYLIWNYSQPVLLALSMLYVGTGIFIRAGGIIRRRFRPHPPQPHPEHQAG